MGDSVTRLAKWCHGTPDKRREDLEHSRRKPILVDAAVASDRHRLREPTEDEARQRRLRAYQQHGHTIHLTRSSSRPHR